MATKEADEIWKNVMTTMLQQVELERQNVNVAAESIELQKKYYVSYLEAYKQLERCYNILTHPQKRLVVRKSLDAVVGRLLETRQILRRLTNYPFPDIYQLITDGTAQPDQFTVPVPRYNLQDSPSIIQRNQLFKILVDRYNCAQFSGSLFDAVHTQPNYKPGTGLVPEKTEQQTQQTMNIAEAILLIQRAERGRNARVRYNLFKNLDRNRQMLNANDVVVNREAAAICLQKHWRSVICTRIAADKRQAEMIFLGLASQTLAKNSSVLPFVKNMVSKEIIMNQKKIDQDYQQKLDKKCKQLLEILYQPNKLSSDNDVLPHQSNLSLCPLATASDPATIDPIESIYSLSRQIDKINVQNQAAKMAKNRANLLDSAFCLADDQTKKLVVKQNAAFLLSDKFQNIMAQREKDALITSNKLLMQAERKMLKQQIVDEEAEQLKEQYLKRHWAAIENNIYENQMGGPQDQQQKGKSSQAPQIKKDIVIPKEPLPILDQDEYELVNHVLDYNKITRGKKKKGKKAKGAATGPDMDQVDPEDVPNLNLSPFIRDLVNQTIEYFVRWQRNEQEEGEVYNAEFIKEMYRPKVHAKVFIESYQEVAQELYNMACTANILKVMGTKKNPKIPKKSKKNPYAWIKKPEVVKVGPVGPVEVETAYAELVNDGIIKIPKPATFDNIVSSEIFFPADRQNYFMKQQAFQFFAKQQETAGGMTKEQLAALKLENQQKLEQMEADVKLNAKSPVMSYNNIKNTIVQDIILPIANPALRAISKNFNSPKRILLFGAPGSGKSLFTRAIATQLGGIFVDLSPANLIGKFPQPEIKWLYDQIDKIVKVNSPVIIYIDEAELLVGAPKKGAAKKGAKFDDGTPGASMMADGYPKTAEKQMSPERLNQKDLKKRVEKWSAMGAILIGNATRTFKREAMLSKFFDQMIYLPLPDYTMRLKLISEFLTNMGLPQFSLQGVGKDVRCMSNDAATGERNDSHLVYSGLGLMGLQNGLKNNGIGSGKIFDISSLARVLDGFTAGQIQEIIFDTLTPTRLGCIGVRPLDIQEFLPAICGQTPHKDSEVSHFALWDMNVVK